MELFVRDNIFDNLDFQRKIALEAVENATKFREITPWDLVGAESSLNHNIEIKQFIAESVGNCEIVNKKRHFNSCQQNPHNIAHIHYDKFDYILIAHLNLPSQLNSAVDGTYIVSDRETGENRWSPEIEAELDELYEGFPDSVADSRFCKLHRWNKEVFIPAVSNRAVIFEPKYLHCESRLFGHNLETSRLVEVLYVNRVD